MVALIIGGLSRIEATLRRFLSISGCGARVLLAPNVAGNHGDRRRRDARNTGCLAERAGADLAQALDDLARQAGHAFELEGRRNRMTLFPLSTSDDEALALQVAFGTSPRFRGSRRRGRRPPGSVRVRRRLVRRAAQAAPPAAGATASPAPCSRRPAAASSIAATSCCCRTARAAPRTSSTGRRQSGRSARPGVSRRSALSMRSSRRCSARDVNMRYGSRQPLRRPGHRSECRCRPLRGRARIRATRRGRRPR